MSMLARLDPKRSPTARFGVPMRTAERSVANSGSEVAAASITAPVHIRPSPVRSAIASAERVRSEPAPTTTVALAANARMYESMLVECFQLGVVSRLLIQTGWECELAFGL